MFKHRIAFILALHFLLTTTAFTGQKRQQSDVSVLKNKSASELLKCFSVADKCGVEDSWEIADHLGKPENKSFLLSAFWATKDESQQLGIIYSLYRIDDSEVVAFYRRLVAQRFDDGEELYYPLNYLAKRCDSAALGALSGNSKGGYKGYPGCMQWATTVELFGKCKYKPSIPYLINSITAACMNIGIAAVTDLKNFYPGSPDFQNYSPEQIQQYFQRRVEKESRPKP